MQAAHRDRAEAVGRPKLVDSGAKTLAISEWRPQRDSNPCLLSALFSYAPDDAAVGREAATVVDRILKGAKPSDLPVEQPRKFELVVNLKTAKLLGLVIPSSVLVRTDRVVE